MQQIRMFTRHGDEPLLEYDPATANMDEVNAFVDRLEAETGGRAFSLASGEAVDKVTRDTQDVFILKPIAGG